MPSGRYVETCLTACGSRLPKNESCCRSTAQTSDSLWCCHGNARANQKVNEATARRELSGGSRNEAEGALTKPRALQAPHSARDSGTTVAPTSEADYRSISSIHLSIYTDSSSAPHGHPSG